MGIVSSKLVSNCIECSKLTSVDELAMEYSEHLQRISHISNSNILPVAESYRPDNTPSPPQRQHDAGIVDHNETPVLHSVSNATMTQLREKQRILDEWRNWASRGKPHEERYLAVKKLREFYRYHLVTELSLQGLGLSSLPQCWPATITSLDLSKNRLKCLPGALPAKLEMLDISFNSLSLLPGLLPDCLKKMIASSNKLLYLPPSLPAKLDTMDISHNNVINWPAALPRRLRILIANDNAFTQLPWPIPPCLERLELKENLISTIDGKWFFEPSPPTVSLQNNPLTEQARQNIDEARKHAHYGIIRFHYSPEHSVAQMNNKATGSIQSYMTRIPCLLKSAAGWYPDDQLQQILTLWQPYEREPYAANFAYFLDRLANTATAKNTTFIQSVREWLHKLSLHSMLRDETFSLCRTLLNASDNRIALTFNTMTILRISSDIEYGLYQHVPDRLYALSKGIFRLRKLETLIWQFIRNTKPDNQIDVCLAYQVELRDRLNLPLLVTEMTAYDPQIIGEQEFSQAVAETLRCEEADFIHWLAVEWAPWLTMIEYEYPALYRMAIADIQLSIEEQFDHILNSRLALDHLENDDDARRIVGLQIMNEYKAAHFMPMTRLIIQGKSLDRDKKPIRSKSQPMPRQTRGR